MGKLLRILVALKGTLIPKILLLQVHTTDLRKECR